MPEYFMGQLLDQPELPANSPRPPETPPDGIIVTDIDGDGYTRRYLFKALGGESNQVLISETPTERVMGQAVPVDRPEREPVSPREEVEVAQESPRPLMGAPQPIPSVPISRAEAAQMNSPVLMRKIELGRSVSVPGVASPLQSPVSTPTVFAVDHPDLAKSAPVRTSPSLGGPTSLMSQEIRLRMTHSPMLGQTNQAQLPPPPSLPPAPPNAPMQSRVEEPASGMEQPVARRCPGAIEMPDGRQIQPEESPTLADLCEIIPFLMESHAQAQGRALAPGQKVPVVGQPSGPGGAVPTSSQFGPAGGPGGMGGGGGFVGGGGGGPGPRGFQGAVGAMGPAGSAAIESVSKTDGDFVAGPGAFIPVPGTSLTFTQATDGAAVLFVNATLGTTSGAGSLSQSGQIGIRVDGVDYVIATRLLHTFVGGVGEFQIGQSGSVTLSLVAGSHTAEIVLRGLIPGEFGGSGIGTPLGVVADSSNPLVLTAFHR